MTRQSFTIPFTIFLSFLFLLLGISWSLAEEKNEESSPKKIFVYNLEPTKKINLMDPDACRDSWDEAHLVAALQGLVNRKGPRLYLYFVSQWGVRADRFWLEALSHPLPDGSSGWLEGTEITEIDSLAKLLDQFREDYQGVVVYDERVPATSNLASTIAGVEDLLPVRFDERPDSLYYRLVESPTGPKLPVKQRLFADDGGPMFTGTGKIPGTDLDSTGSAKGDAYRWLIENYIKTGKTSSLQGGYYMDAWWITHPNDVQNHLLVNHDYFIARKGFFFDLPPWEDETPVDDPNQPLGTDHAVFCDLLRAVYDRNGGEKMAHIAGFTPWDRKYTNAVVSAGKHDAVATEWHHAEILSSFNAYMDADALGMGAMANASFFAHFPLKEIYPQKKPTLDDLSEAGLLDKEGKPIPKTFVMFYIGDYDSAAWVYQALPIFWPDKNRGTIPLGWAFNPNLSDRFAAGLDYLRRTASANDFFVAGDSGAGYINPMSLVEPRRFSGLPSGVDTWRRHCEPYYRRWDLTVTGFLIDGFSSATDEGMRSVYAKFSPDGIVLHQGGQEGLTDGMPWIAMRRDLPSGKEVKEAISIVLDDTPPRTEEPLFRTYRTVIWNPTELKALYDGILADPEKGGEIEIVDPYSFFLLLKQAKLHPSDK